MRNFYVFILRLLIGVAFGIILARIFKPEWSIIGGAGLGVGLVAVVYLLDFMKKRKKQN